MVHPVSISAKHLLFVLTLTGTHLHTRYQRGHEVDVHSTGGRHWLSLQYCNAARHQAAQHPLSSLHATAHLVTNGRERLEYPRVDPCTGSSASVLTCHRHRTRSAYTYEAECSLDDSCCLVDGKGVVWSLGRVRGLSGPRLSVLGFPLWPAR